MKKRNAIVRSLDNEEDVRSSQGMGESAGSNRLKIPERKTPWYLLSGDYVDGFAHYVETDEGGFMRVACHGGAEGGGFAPQDCPLCKQVMGMYRKAKALRNLGKEKAADKLKNAANQMKAKYEAKFVAVRGSMVVERNSDGKKVWVPEFDFNPQEADDTAVVGILSLTHAQFKNLTGLKDDESVPHVKSGHDLLNRVIYSEKKSTTGRGKQQFKEVHWSAATRKSDPPEIPDFDITADEYRIDDQFVISDDDMKKVMTAIAGEVIDDPDDDRESDDDTNEAFLKEDAAEEEEVVEDDEEEVVEKKPRKVKKEADEDFLDDIPYDEEEEEEEKPKRRKSGKARL